ncbi:MAG: T9SS sorting signal type C domain-containing protein [Flavobacterium sp.]|nr:T9SS sorting signal type C domain-containing protein [Flavobacterium sp.]
MKYYCRLHTNNNLIVNSSLHEIQHIIIFDMLGRTLAAEMNVNTNEFEFNQMSSESQPLLMKIVLSNGKVVFKKAIF